MHLDDLLGDGEPEARTALGLGVGAVDLMELLEDPILLVGGIPGPVSVTETAKWPFRAPAAMLTWPASVNLMAFGRSGRVSKRRDAHYIVATAQSQDARLA